MAEDHLITQGEDVLSVTHFRGLLWKSVWEDAKNADLRTAREDPNILMPGDVLHVPDLEEKTESGATEKKHRFKTPTVKVKVDLRLIRPLREEGERMEQEATDPWEYREVPPGKMKVEPMAGVPFVILADGVEVAKGQTDGDGRIQEKVPTASSAGTLILHQGTDTEQRYDLRWRHMDPLKEVSGVCKRLFNLGLPCPPETTVTPAVAGALRIFQQQNNVPVTGQADEATRAKLKEKHGC